MVRAERALGDGERAPEQGLGLPVTPFGLPGGGEQAETQSHPRILRADALGPLEGRREEALRLRVVPLLQGAIARGHRHLPASALGRGLGRGAGGAQQEEQRREHPPHAPSCASRWSW